MTGHIEFMPKPNMRDKLLDAGLERIHSLGFNACSVQDITESAGMPKGSFYNYFESKEALGIEILELYWHQAAVSLNILKDEALPPIERIKCHFDSLASNLSEMNYERGCLFGNLAAELSDQSVKVRERLSSLFADWTYAIECCVRDAQNSNSVRTDLDASNIAAFLINAWEGTVLRTKINRDPTAVTQFNTMVFSTILV